MKMLKKFLVQRSSKAGAREDLDFLPAALEVLERPPSPHGRLLGWVLMALFTLAVTWACIGQVNIVAVAQGQVISSSRSKDIQPLEKGVLKTIYVREGQFVHSGDPLIELDQTVTQAEKLGLMEQLRYTRANLERRREFVRLLENAGNPAGEILPTPPLPDSLQATSASSQVAATNRLLQQEWLDYMTRMDGYDSELNERLAQLQANSAQISKVEKILPIVEKRLQALQRLQNKGLASEMDYLDAKQEFIQQQQTHETLLARQKQYEAEIDSRENSIDRHRSESLKTSLQEIDKLENQVSTLVQQLAKAEDSDTRRILRAPVDGTIHQLAVHTVGGVVTEAQVLMKLVPRDDFLQVEAVLDNKDIGFVFEGQTAEVKINTFNFTRYGVIGAEVIDVTADAIMDEVHGLVYKLRLRLDTEQMQIDGRAVNLIPGMAVTAEVKTGRRRLIEFVLSPLLRKVSQSVGER